MVKWRVLLYEDFDAEFDAFPEEVQDELLAFAKLLEQFGPLKKGKEVEAMKTIDQKMKSIGAKRRKKIKARAAALVAEEMTLQELRRARKLTQVRMAKALGITQDGVSRLEKRSDLLLSTLRKSVRAMGGNLSLVAEFPDREPVILSGIATVEKEHA